MSNQTIRIELEDIRKAHKRIKPYIHKTPVLTCSTLNRMFETELFFKCENFQKVGAFKARGATNAVFSLSEKEAQRGVTTHSSGNHAAALALAARRRGIKSYVVMPKNSPLVKVRAVKGYGAEIHFCEPTLKAREEGLEKIQSRTGAIFIHPYNNEKIIAGQGTAALELCNEVKNLDIVIAPVGGGGLLSGTAIAVSGITDNTQIFAAEPKGADDAYRSFLENRLIPSQNPNTIADGLLTSLGELTFPIIKKYVKKILTVSDEEIIKAMRLIWERMKIIVEPSAAVTLAAIISRPTLFNDKRIGLILSGGNVDLHNLPWQ